MPSPFPGMDPYLESPAIFPDLHDSLIIHLKEAINPRLPAPYIARSAKRIWIEESHRHIEPDVDVLRPRGSGKGSRSAGGVAVIEEVEAGAVQIHVIQEEFRELFLEVYTLEGEERLVTSVEILSLSNKTPGNKGRTLYLQKQRELLNSEVHLVEIDLLRGGTHSTAVPLPFARERAGAFDFHVCTRRFDKPFDYFVFPIQLSNCLPTILIPLLPGTPSVRIDLQPLLDHYYDVNLCARDVDYRRPPDPPLRPEQAAWAEQLLRAKGLLG